jgi:uncharacterized membrane protein
MDDLISQIGPSLTEVGGTILALLAGIALLEAVLYIVFSRILKSKHTLPIMLLAPAAVGLIAVVVYPLIWEFNLSRPHHLREF